MTGPLHPLDLTPAGTADFTRVLAQQAEALAQIDPAVIESIWDAWRCPAPLLPWLAWALSVDSWDDAWAEPIKRQAIADSPEYHRRKGTVRAVKSALALADRPFEITEWWQAHPPARRGTARVFIETSLEDVARVLAVIRPLVMAAKPKSRSVAFGAGERQAASFVAGAGLLVETFTDVAPYAYAGEELDAAFVVGAGILTETQTTVEAIA